MLNTKTLAYLHTHKKTLNDRNNSITKTRHHAYLCLGYVAGTEGPRIYCLCLPLEKISMLLDQKTPTVDVKYPLLQHLNEEMTVATVSVTAAWVFTKDYILENLDAMNNNNLFPCIKSPQPNKDIPPTIEHITTTFLIYLPSKYIKLFLDKSGYTVQEVWKMMHTELLNHNNHKANQALLKWLQVTSHHSEVIDPPTKTCCVCPPINTIMLRPLEMKYFLASRLFANQYDKCSQKTMPMIQKPIVNNHKKRHKKSAQTKKKKYITRVKKINLVIIKQTKRRCSNKVVKLERHSAFITLNNHKIHHFKNVFSGDKMNKLATALNQQQHLFEFKIDDTRGSKKYFTSGEWLATGHCRPGIDSLHAAGKAGKTHPTITAKIDKILLNLSTTATKILKKCRPDIYQMVGENNYYGAFNIFIAPRGVSKIHKDSNDMLSFLFLIQSPHQGGELEIAGTNYAISWNIGDVIIFDSADIYHGSRKYNGNLNTRIVGDFIIQKTYCRYMGFLNKNT